MIQSTYKNKGNWNWVLDAYSKYHFWGDKYIPFLSIFKTKEIKKKILEQFTYELNSLHFSKNGKRRPGICGVSIFLRQTITMISTDR